jgi:hypothetical protein
LANIDKEKLCKLADKKYPKKKFAEYAELIRKAAYICEKCGRAAAVKKNLCKPQKIEI